jgi:hypothetical protein
MENLNPLQGNFVLNLPPVQMATDIAPVNIDIEGPPSVHQVAEIISYNHKTKVAKLFHPNLVTADQLVNAATAEKKVCNACKIYSVLRSVLY